MLVSGGWLYVGTASNFFVPDTSTSLHTSIGLFGGLPTAPGGPFIGTQVWASAFEDD